MAPSFEQISIAVQSVIAEASVDDSGPGDDVRDTVLSSEHQLVMTWCWLNIRVSRFTVINFGSCVCVTSNEFL